MSGEPTRTDQAIARLRARALDWPIPWCAVEDMARREDCRLTAYRCPAGIWTVGWGETEGVTADMRWTGDQADARLHQQLRRYAAKVEAMLTEHANENQLGALVSLGYNIGLGALAGSTVLRQHNAGQFANAARAFGLWDKARDPATGELRPLAGLTARRAAESALYLTPPAGAPADRMPQAVAGESPLSASPIARGGAVTAAAGAATAGATVVDKLGEASGMLSGVRGLAQQVVEAVGVPPGVLLAIVLIGAGIAVMKWRAKQREQGWA